MKHQKLTEAEERRLAEAIAAEARALGLTSKKRMPVETKRRIRARVMTAILDDRLASESQLVAEKTFSWKPQIRRRYRIVCVGIWTIMTPCL